MSKRADIEATAAQERLFVSGVVNLEGRNVALLSPDEPAFWPHFLSSPEAQDGAPDPLDRWSARVISAMAERLAGEAIFPFGGPPWHPFLTWAVDSGEAWQSPIGLIVGARSGLFVSYRGAIAVSYELNQSPDRSPCLTCTQPCLGACPVGAFAGGTYDVPLCKAHLDTEAGADCRNGGCLVRRACPVGAGRRLPEQSAFHMKAFHPHDA